MSKRLFSFLSTSIQRTLGAVALALLVASNPLHARPQMQVVAGDGSSFPAEPVALLDPVALEALVAPIALYPDDLLAIALPAATYPLQVVQAQRFLEARREGASLEPSDEWDDSVVALLNYPEVVELLNDDLDWTWALGEAVLAQQEDVLEAVAAFRERARVAGNLRSDDFQIVEGESDGLRIRPRDPEVIYVPYYEPSRVTVYHSRPVYHYYPARYPLYYYPYAPGHRFASGFWGVTSAFSIGWTTRRLHVHYVTYRDHPYYGHHYYDRYFYRRPPSFRVDDHWQWSGGHVHPGRHHAGNDWHPRAHRRGPSPRHHHRHRHHDGKRDGDHDADRRRGRLVARGSVVNGVPVPESTASRSPQPTGRDPAPATSQAVERRSRASDLAALATARARAALAAKSAASSAAVRAQRPGASPAARPVVRQTRRQQSIAAYPSRPSVPQRSRPGVVERPQPAVALRSRPATAQLSRPSVAQRPRPAAAQRSQSSPAARISRPALTPGTTPRVGRGPRTGGPTRR